MDEQIITIDALEEVQHAYPSVTVENDVMKIRASAYGGCYRALAAEGVGYMAESLPKNLLEVFGEGRKREPIILQRLIEEYEVDLILPSAGTSRSIDLKIADGLYITGHIDGLGIYGGKKYVIEVKTASPDSYQYFLRHGLDKAKIATYPWQVSAYYYGMKEQEPDLAGVLYAVQEKSTGDAWTDKISLFEIPIPHTFDQVSSRALVIRQYVNSWIENADDVPPCSNNSLCGFRYLHDEKVITASNDELLAKYCELNEEKKERSKGIAGIEKELKEIKKEIEKEWAGNAAIKDGIEVNGFRITMSKVEPEVLDTVKLGEVVGPLGYEVKDFYIKGAGYYRIDTGKVKTPVVRSKSK